MNASRKTLSVVLLSLFLGMGMVSFFAPPAPPVPDSATCIVVLSENDDTNFNEGFFRTALHGEEEGVRVHPFMPFISLEGFHHNNCLVKLSITSKQFNTRSHKNSLYLLNSCLTI